MRTIPYMDIRDRGPRMLVETYPEKSLALMRASKNIYGVASRMLSRLALPVGDYASQQWLKRNDNPYQNEIDYYAACLGIRGVYALNLCYEWGCTSGAYAQGHSIHLARVLDWPFPELGENIVVALQSGDAGDFYNVTWPGIAGVFNAMAPGRFAAALNQAPMRRYKTNIAVDWVRNRITVRYTIGLPPAHLLRVVFEQATTYAEAKTMLCNMPVAIPVIYILTGTNPEEGCVIERLENAHAVRELRDGKACAANHFESHLNGVGRGWSLRGVDSEGRSNAAYACSSNAIARDFAWFTAPIANPYSKLVMVTDAGIGMLKLIGTNGAESVTAPFDLLQIAPPYGKAG